MSETAQAVAVTLSLTGLPDTCPHCEERPLDGIWVLRSYRTLLEVACPWCHVTVAPVRAVTADRSEETEQ